MRYHFEMDGGYVYDAELLSEDSEKYFVELTTGKKVYFVKKFVLKVEPINP